MTTRISLSLSLLLICCSTLCKAQSVADTAAIKKLLTGVRKQDFRQHYLTDDNSISGEKIAYCVREDSVIVIAEKYFLKIEKLTKDSLVYRMAFSADFKFNEKPHALNRITDTGYSSSVGFV